MVDKLEPDATRSLDELLETLGRLDRLLAQAIALAQTIYGAEAATDRYRGLHITPGEAERLLAQAPGAPILYCPADVVESIAPSTRFAWLQRAYQLSPFEMDVVAIALAPEFDLRYERLYAYLQDNVTRKRPTVDLALNLLCSSVEAKLQQRQVFASDAPLVRHHLLHLVSDQPHAPLLTQSFRLDEQILRLLLGQNSLDGRLDRCCDRTVPTVRLEALPLKREVKQALWALLRTAKHQPLQLYFQGVQGSGRRW
ncbi:MAG: hypothetical protein HC895_11905 [Leptolyngbyaceae cyanobacterium SM1_3_5]|nr:hypothetical protein [Leptolyngbyaceae cyanobacterium SM1_3_5]